VFFVCQFLTNPKPMKTPRLLLLAILAFVITGCATKTKEAKAEGEQAAAEDEYVYVPSATGSNLPKKVKKSDIVSGKITKDGKVVTVDKDEFSRNLRPGRQLETGGAR